MKFYVLDENNNKVEAFDKEGTLAVLQQAINDGTLENIVADAAFVSKLKCCVSGDTHNMAFVTQAKYNELVETNGLLENTYYWITDDSTCEDLDNILEELTEAVNGLINAINKVPQRELIVSNIEIAGGTESSTVIAENLKEGWYEVNVKSTGNPKTIKVYVNAISEQRQYQEVLGCDYDLGAAADEDMTKGIFLTVVYVNCSNSKISVLSRRFSTAGGWKTNANILTVENVYKTGE